MNRPMLLILLLSAAAALAQAPPAPYPELRDEPLERALGKLAGRGHRTLGYKRAREAMYWRIDNENGQVTDVYGQRPIAIEAGEWPSDDILNAEHLWPQSRGAKRDPARSDLYHLRPCDPRLNSLRSNTPFGTPAGAEHQQTHAAGREADGDEAFLPPAAVRGDIARALFYFSVRYTYPIGNDEEEDLRRWHRADPVDEEEWERAQKVREEQGNINPFILWPELAGRISDF